MRLRSTSEYVAAYYKRLRAPQREKAAMSHHHIARSSVLRLLVAFVPITLLLCLSLPAHAIEVPPSTALTFVQTNGPDAQIGLGDWYTSKANGVGAGFHYFAINIPCDWPATEPVMLDIFSPEMHASRQQVKLDEVSGTPSDTAFELYGPGTKVGPNPGVPAPNTGIAGSLKTYTPFGYNIPANTPIPPESWVRYYTLAAPVQCGTYILRSQAGTIDQNGWRLRIGFDKDNDPTNTPPTNYDNPDGIAGTGDELTIGIAQTSYQNEVVQAGIDQCLTLYQYVDPGLQETFFHNFDLDKTSPPAVPPAQRVRYYSPVDTYDPLALTGGVAGTASGSVVWDDNPSNGPSVQRSTGDRVANPVGGWWRIVTCINNHNQYIQEGQTGILTYYQQPPTPVLTVTKDDGLTVTSPNNTQTYTIKFANTSDTTATPGAAVNVVLTDKLPSNVTFVSCAIDAPITGTCSQSNGVVTYQINGTFVAGASGTAKVTVQVNPNASGTVVNTITIDGKDTIGNPLPSSSATDIDTISNTADLSLVKTVDKAAAKVGDNIEFTLTLKNDGPDTATNVQVTDQWPTGLTFVSSTPSQGTYDSATGAWTVGSLANGASATLKIVATVLASGSYTNSAQVSASDQFDPDSTPGNNNPSEDDQSSAGPTSPTAITLEHFNATRQAGVTEVSWTTSAEINTWHFQLLRSTDGERTHAVQVTDAPITARGRNTGGATYSWTDSTAQPTQSYTYWLQETALDGSVTEYGPASVGVATSATGQRVLLPVVIKR